jgi:hypothetical protein
LKIFTEKEEQPAEVHSEFSVELKEFSSPSVDVFQRHAFANVPSAKSGK